RDTTLSARSRGNRRRPKVPRRRASKRPPKGRPARRYRCPEFAGTRHSLSPEMPLLREQGNRSPQEQPTHLLALTLQIELSFAKHRREKRHWKIILALSVSARLHRNDRRGWALHAPRLRRAGSFADRAGTRGRRRRDRRCT